jgi:hypothetical protein
MLGPPGARNREPAGEDILAAVVSDDVEPALGAEADAQVAIGDDDPLLAEHMAESPPVKWVPAFQLASLPQRPAPG